MKLVHLVALLVILKFGPGIKIHMKFSRFTFALLTIGAVLFAAIQASACPTIDGLIDYNCDQFLKISVTGDSIVRGAGDPNYTEESGGYVLDLDNMLTNARVVNIGVPGINSRGLYRAYRRNAPRGRVTYNKLKGADYIIIEVGTNDYWQHGPAQATVRNLVRIKEFLEAFGEREFGVAPLVMVTTLPPTKRSFQQPFIDSVNKQLLLSRNVERLNVRVRFDSLSTRVVSRDLLHPSPGGYRTMAKKVYAALTHWATKTAESLRPDEDRDQVYDIFETSRFFTDPTLSDTDGDTLLDGAELFVYGLNPLSVDTDGDGTPDNIEVATGSLPPAPTPEPWIESDLL